MTRLQWKVIGVSHYYTLKSRKTHDEKLVAIDRVTFTQSYGEIVGLIGGKGAGKSTLASVLLEQIEPSEGLVSGFSEKAGILGLPQLRSEERTGENYTRQQLLKWGVPKKRLAVLSEQIWTFSELGNREYDKLRTYTKEEKIQLEISILLHVSPSFLYIDESILMVKEHFYIKVFIFLLELKELGSSIWIETNQVACMENYCDKLLWLEWGQLRKHGDVSDVLPAYDDYYFQIKRLTTSQQQQFWEDGYRGQLMRGDLFERGSDRLMVEEEVEKEIDVQKREKFGVSFRDDNATKFSRTTKREAVQKGNKVNPIYLVGGAFLVSIAVLISLNYAEFNDILHNETTVGKRHSSIEDSIQVSTNKQEQTRASTGNSTLPETTPKIEKTSGTYVVQRGDSLSEIADKFKVSVSQLREWNQLGEEEVQPEEILLISQPLVTQEINLPVADFTYLVVAGDTLEIIAEIYGVKVEELKKVNKLTDTTIYTGSSLSLPATAKDITTNLQVVTESAVVSIPPTSAEAPIVSNQHAVEKGETLYGIARQYGVDVMALQQANHLQTEQLYLGQELIIP